MTRLAGLTFVVLAVSTAARAEVTNCTVITSVPYQVTAPGIYCLKNSLSWDLSAYVLVDIQADDVVLDLNGHTLDGSGAGPGTGSIGVRAVYRKNVTVRNGTLRGLGLGVYLGLGTSSGHIVENLRVDHCTQYGIIVQHTPGGIVRNNLVVGMGGATSNIGPYAIYASGAGVHVVDNEVVETVENPGGAAYGIIVEQGSGAVIERNVVSNSAFGPAASQGIRLSYSASKVTVVGNRIANMRNGIYFYPGATGIYMDNTVVGATTPFTGGTAAGTTNFSF
jgi:nitrous oxidase accessory protein NosD